MSVLWRFPEVSRAVPSHTQSKVCALLMKLCVNGWEVDQGIGKTLFEMILGFMILSHACCGVKRCRSTRVERYSPGGGSHGISQSQQGYDSSLIIETIQSHEIATHILSVGHMSCPDICWGGHENGLWAGFAFFRQRKAHRPFAANGGGASH